MNIESTMTRGRFLALTGLAGGFEGYVIADWAAIQGLEKRMRFAQTQEEAAAMAIKAGIDQECFRHKTKAALFV